MAIVYDHRLVTETVRVMKITTAIILGFCLHVSATGISQNVSFSGDNVPLNAVISSIEEQTGLVFIYSDREIKKANAVTIDVKQIPLREFLNLIFTNQPLYYNIRGNTIFIGDKKKENEFPSVVNELSPPITVKGKIINEKGEPVVASVVVKGTKNGATTDTYGNFVLNNVDDNATLMVSGINIEAQEVKIGERSEIVIKAIMKIAEEEVVVKTNYYSTTKKLSTGNISKVTAKEINNQSVVSPLLALQGRVPGLEITMPSNAIPGAAPQIRIRGTNSLRVVGKNATSYENDGNYPLYVIDGVPINSIPLSSLGSDLTSGGYDPLSSINLANIESIEVLKDADATAIYGSRGANGVILITTKRATRFTEKTNLELSSYIGSGKLSNKLELLNTEQYISMRREALTNDNLLASNFDHDLVYWDQNRYTDWQEVFL